MNFAGTYTYLMDTPSGKRETKIVIRKTPRAYEGELVSSHGGCELLENIHTTGFENEAQVMNAEYASYLLRCAETFDIAFLDPPYRTGTLTKALLAVTPHMNRGGIVICEHPTDEELPETAGEFVRVRDYRYGKILLTAYRHQSMV